MLRDQPEPITLSALVRLSSLHENTVRGHVDALVAGGLVRREQAPPSGRGRPPWRFSLTEAAAVVGGDEERSNEYAGLAAVLADTLTRTAPDPEAAGAEAGAAWGRELAHDRGATPLPGPEAQVAVRDLLDDLGFATEALTKDGRELRLTRCPLLEAAHRNPEVVCSVHLGIVRGALTEFGHPDTDSVLVPFAEPGACRLTLPVLDAE